MPVHKRALRTVIVVLVALGLVATVLAAGCGSSTTTTQAPAATTTTSSSGTTGTTGGGTATTAGITTTSGASADGKALFAQYCGVCHKNGLGKVAAADQSRIENVIKTGKDNMPGFASKLSAEQITAIFNYLTTAN
jgi:mono/diheme cytochrome c family protein